MNMERRRFVKLLAAAGGATLAAGGAFGEGRHDFRPAQLQYSGGQPVPYPSALRSLMRTLKLRTSIDADEDKLEINPLSPELFRYPFLYLAGRSSFDPFSDEAVAKLRLFLKSGGFLLIDDASGINNSPFDTSVRREIKRILPENNLERLDSEHTVFRSFYLLDRIGGRILVKDYLEGITLGSRSPVIYSQNDLGGAWATDLYERPLMECSPGGERQREMAYRLGINIVMYALCLNYKKDRVHVEAILERRKLR